MSNLTPTLPEGHGILRPEIHTLKSLGRAILSEFYSQIYWIKHTDNNVVVEYYLLKNPHIEGDSSLTGMVNDGPLNAQTFEHTITISPDAYVIVSLK